jgi:DNA-binding MarR family transcriptional regulator
MVQVVNDSLALANELRPVLLRLARRVRREAAELGVTAGQATLLAVIGERPGISGSELSEAEQISAPGVSAHLDRLEEAGLIVRERAADRRRVGVSLSPEGARVLRSIRKKRTAWLAERLDGLSGGERAAIDAAIGPLARLLEGEGR